MARTKETLAITIPPVDGDDDIGEIRNIVGFHIRLAHGLDYEDASPVRGVRTGGGTETMHSFAKVESGFSSQQ